MATLALHDIEPELLEELTRRAERLGTTVEREALRALREHFAELPNVAANDTWQTPTSSASLLAKDARFVKANGFWVFTGALDSNSIPDHRELRETRLESFVRDALGENSD